MNNIVLMGRLVKDPEVRYTQSGKVVCQFTLAVDRPFSNQNGQKEADFIPVVVWGKIAEIAGNSLSKGHRALVEGRLQIRNYTANDGSKRYVSEVIAGHFEFVEKRAEVAPQQPAPQQPASQQGGGMESFGSEVPFDEEIPF